MTEEKKNIRLETKKNNKDKRKSMLVKVFSFNIQKNKLSKIKKNYLSLLFREAKWYYNYLISLSQKQVIDNYGDLVYAYNLFNFKTKYNWITIYNPKLDCFEDYEIQVLSSQMKQTILENIQNSIKAMAAAKAKGRKAGKLKFKSYVPVPLKQLNFTYYLSDNLKKLSLQGNKKLSLQLTRNRNINKLVKGLNLQKVNLKQLTDLGEIELANAQLVSDSKEQYTFNLTCYVKPTALAKAGLFQGLKLSNEERKVFSESTLGIDANIGHEYVFNLGDKFSSISLDTRKDNVKYLNKIKKQQRKLNRFISKSKKKGIRDFRTNEFYNLKNNFNVLQDKLNNKKLDQVRKIVSFTKCFKAISFQNENIKSWHANKGFRFSRIVQQGTLGKTYAKFKLLSNVESSKYKQIDKFARTTKTCICGEVNKDLTLNDREYLCSKCGYKNHRDVHGSYIINHYDEIIGKTGCGTQPGSNNLTSNQKKMKFSVRTELAVNVLLNKIKSKNCKALAFNQTTEALSFTAG